MSKLSVEQKTIRELLGDSKSDFLIPDYQRPYAWEFEECQTLWDDIFNFAIPDNDCTKFDDENDEYFLGPIVTFKNGKKQEIIDGQQRLTTLMLLLRAFYSRFANMKDQNSINTRKIIESCIWKADVFGNPNMSALKIDSEVASDNDKEEFLSILRTGIPNGKSRYALNYRFFEEKVIKFLSEFPGYFAYLPIRILNNCILLPIEADNQDTALRIFSTLNDRGKPLSDADIFKAQFYKFYDNIGKKDEFIEKWKTLEELCKKLFKPIIGTPMDDLFMRYMYFQRAKNGIKSSTTEALRRFYEGKNSYELLKKEETFNDLIDLADFWKDITSQNHERFSDEALKLLFVLEYAPNGMWNYFISVYYLQNRDSNSKLNDHDFCKFLQKITAFIWGYAVLRPGVNALRTPVYAEMVNVVTNKEVTFSEFLFEESEIRNAIENYAFTNNRAITKSFLAWWAFQHAGQSLLNLDTSFETEHIFARNRQEKEHSLKNVKNMEALGNKALLEKRINIRASDYRFEDKKKYYIGFQTERGLKEATQIKELFDLAQTRNDFNETNIENRNKQIIDGFINNLKMNGLLK